MPWERPSNDVAVGELILLSAGEYHYYRPEGLYRALKPFNFAMELRAFIAETGTGTQAKRIKGDNYEGVVKFLVDRGLLALVKHKELWIGCYGTIGSQYTCDHPNVKEEQFGERLRRYCANCQIFLDTDEETQHLGFRP